MAAIKLLPEHLINTIAAGEVVERPGAALKELVENSLDAGADAIEIDIQMGGKKLIRVADNGRGMDRDDILMALERHATSKIDKNSDLIHINTLGFRGEALPSIGAVSRLAIVSATEGGEGHRVLMENGTLRLREKAPRNRGTTVEVADLFRNVPARRKFLKSDQTEAAHLLDAAQRYALSREGLRLVYRDNGREILSVDKTHDFKTRVFRVMGREAALGLAPFECGGENLRIHGFLGSPESASGASSKLYLYVLGRPVKDRLLTRAVIQGYGRTLPRGRFPAAVIFVEPAPEDVDVNVHPAKTEVRFREPNRVFSLLSEAVERIVGRAILPAFAPPAAPAAVSYEEARMEPPQKNGEPSAPPPWMMGEEAGREAPPAPPERREAEAAKISSATEVPAPENSPNPPREPVAGYFLSPPCGQAPPLTGGLAPIGQLKDSYILAQGVDGLYIVDQHAAHERILYNQLKRNLEERELASQSLMFPETRQLSPHQALAAEKLSSRLSALGFELTHLGGTDFMLRAAPAILGRADPWETLTEILDASQDSLKRLDGAGLAENVSRLTGAWLDSLACRAAIKAGQKLSLAEMSRLLHDMAQTESGGYCPHGRPAIQRYSFADIAKKFHR